MLVHLLTFKSLLSTSSASSFLFTLPTLISQEPQPGVMKKRHWRVKLAEKSVYSRAATKDYFHYQLICWLFSPLIVYSMKCPKSAKNAHLNFPDPSVTPLTCFFCPNNSLKHTKNVLFIIINDAETQPILTFKRPNQQLFTVLQKKDKINWLSKKLAINFLTVD